MTVDEAASRYTEAVQEEATLYAEAREAYTADINAAGDDEDALAEVKSLSARYLATEVRTLTLRVSNGRFDYGSTSVGTSAPSGWTLVTGDDAPTSYRFNGVISASNSRTITPHTRAPIICPPRPLPRANILSGRLTSSPNI